MDGHNLGRLRIFSALRHPNYRWLWLNIFFWTMGRWMEWVAISWLVLELGGSPFILGVAYACRTLPAVFFGGLGGVLADKIGRRKPILIAQATMVSLQWLTASLVVFGVVQIWWILVATLLGGTALAFDQPARHSMIYDLVGKKDLLNAVALNRIAQRTGSIAGAPLAGALMSFAGIGVCLYVIGAMFFLGVLSLLMLRSVVPVAVNSRGKSLWRDFIAAWIYVRSQPHILGVLAVEIAFDVLATYHMLMPLFARDILKVGPTGLGFLFAAEGVGEMVGALFLASFSQVRRRGWVLLGGFLGLGGLLLLFSLSSWYYLSLLLLVVVGLTHTTVMIMVQTLLLSSVPDELRGRVMGIYVLTWGAVPVGSLQAGAVAGLLGAPFALGIGGAVIMLAAGALYITQPKLRQLE